MNENRIIRWINNNTTVVVLLSIFVPLIPLMVFMYDRINHIANDTVWYTIHADYFMFYVYYSVFLLSGKKVTPANVLGIFFLAELSIYFDIWESFSDWFFFQSPFKNSFPGLAAKDENVIMASLLVLSSLTHAVLLGISRYRTKKWQLNRIFVLLGSGALILTIVLFHWFIIEKNYHEAVNARLSILEKIAKTPNEASFSYGCELEKLTCSFHGLNDLSIMPEEKKYFQQFPVQNLYLSGVFTLGGGDFSSRSMIGVWRYKDKWVMDTTSFRQDFKNAEYTFFSLLTFAHVFWIYFTLFLLLFHNRRQFRKPVEK